MDVIFTDEVTGAKYLVTINREGDNLVSRVNGNLVPSRHDIDYNLYMLLQALKTHLGGFSGDDHDMLKMFDRYVGN